MYSLLGLYNTCPNHESMPKPKRNYTGRARLLDSKQSPAAVLGGAVLKTEPKCAALSICKAISNYIPSKASANTLKLQIYAEFKQYLLRTIWSRRVSENI